MMRRSQHAIVRSLVEAYVGEPELRAQTATFMGTLKAEEGDHGPWAFLQVDKGIPSSAFQALQYNGVPCEPRYDNPHVTVVRASEVEELQKVYGKDGWKDAILTGGDQFEFWLKEMVDVEPIGWDEMDRVWFIRIESPELQRRRMSLGLTPLPTADNGMELDFHITVAVRPKPDNGTVEESRRAVLRALFEEPETAAVMEPEVDWEQFTKDFEDYVDEESADPYEMEPEEFDPDDDIWYEYPSVDAEIEASESRFNGWFVNPRYAPVFGESLIEADEADVPKVSKRKLRKALNFPRQQEIIVPAEPQDPFTSKYNPSIARHAANQMKYAYTNEKGEEKQSSVSGLTLWEGESWFDGGPITAILTFGSSNPKTGDMHQVFILRRDVSPVDGCKVDPSSGDYADQSVCGTCPRRPELAHIRREEDPEGRDTLGGCYVQKHTGVNSVYKTYLNGKYPYYDPELHDRLLAGSLIRWGTYGDPAFIPQEIVQHLSGLARAWTGYTHQWEHAEAEWGRPFFMASVETDDQYYDLIDENRPGGPWHTFRARKLSEPLLPGEMVCPASLETEYMTGLDVTCSKCLACSGAMYDRNRNVVIVRHGPMVWHLDVDRDAIPPSHARRGKHRRGAWKKSVDALQELPIGVSRITRLGQDPDIAPYVILSNRIEHHKGWLADRLQKMKKGTVSAQTHENILARIDRIAEELPEDVEDLRAQSGAAIDALTAKMKLLKKKRKGKSPAYARLKDELQNVKNRLKRAEDFLTQFGAKAEQAYNYVPPDDVDAEDEEDEEIEETLTESRRTQIRRMFFS